MATHFVGDGIVELWGAIMDTRERQAFIVAVENVPGVKLVNAHTRRVGIHFVAMSGTDAAG